MSPADSELLRTTEFESPDPTELSLREAFAFLRPRLKPPFSLQTPSPSDYSQLILAIAYGVLTEPRLARTHFTHLHAIVADGYDLFTRTLHRLSLESYPKLLEPARVQLLWVTSELIGVSAVGVERLVISLLRRVNVGDFSEPNLWLAAELVGVLSGSWDWLLEEPSVLTSALFVYLRLLADHYRLAGNRKLEVLKQTEVDFCIRVLRQQFGLCLGIGRDLIRLLQDLVFIPEFRDVWRDLLFDPAAFGVPGYSDITQIYRTRTPVQYFLLGVTPEMEARIRFLLTYVKWGSQRRYQEWFARKFLCGPERESVVTDLVRFVCCAHHPPNEIIHSKVIPRWAVIGWLLKSCRKNYFEANAKLALFYDWLFFDERVDNIMNIEPAILLMVHSVPEYVGFTQTLMEFLFLLVDHYDVLRKDLIVRGVSTAFNVLVRKGVTHSLEPLTACSLISPLLRERLNTFILGSKSEVVKEPSVVGCQKLVSEELKHSTCHGKNGFEAVKNLINSLGATMKQSEDGGLQTLEHLLVSFATLDDRALDTGVGGSSSIVLETLAFQITEAFKSVGYNMFPPLKPLESEGDRDDEIQSATAIVLRTYIFYPHERMRELVSFWYRNGRPVGARLLSYASRLAYEAQTLGKLRNGSVAQAYDSDRSVLQQHIAGYISFRIRGREDSPNDVSLSTTNLTLIAESVEGAFTTYRSFIGASSAMDLTLTNEGSQIEGSLRSMSCKGPRRMDQTPTMSLFSDLLSCCGWNRKKLRSLFHCAFCHLSDLSTAKEEFILLLVELLDHVDTVSLQFEVSLKRLCMFGEESGTICELVKSSINWEFVKQQKLWGLLVSELVVSNVKVEEIVNLCTGFVDPAVHSVAVEGLYTLSRCCSPKPEFIGTVMSLPNSFGNFTAAVLASWVSSNSSLFFSGLVKWLEELSEKMNNFVSIKPIAARLNYHAITSLLKFFDKQGIKNTDGLSSLFVSIPEIKVKLANLIKVVDDR